MALISPCNPLKFINQRQSGDIKDFKSSIFDKRLNNAKNLFKKDLVCHYGCVNAIEFSNDGEFLVSGGDDRRVMLWKFGHTIFEHGKPIQMNNQHLSNIFCLALTSDNTRIFSGGNDDKVIVHDTERKCAVELLLHERAVCGLGLDPYNEKVLATAGNDGRLLLFDTRQSVEESLVISRSRKAFHAVTFHPSQPGILASANARNGAALWDLRKPKSPVLRYGGSCGSTQNCMSVCFDGNGERLLALRRRLPPVLYRTTDASPLAEFYHPDYYNSCTMKSCCFAGERDQFVLSGSDDFNLYMWRVPDNGNAWVTQTHMILYGHRSIVNQVRYNRNISLIASSGVEKIIKTWSPIELPGSRGSLLTEAIGPDNPRDVFSHEDYVSLVHHTGQHITHNYSEQSTSEDPRMMAFFDSLVQREAEGWEREESDSQTDSDSALSERLSKNSDSSDSEPLIMKRSPCPVGTRQTSQIRTARAAANRRSKLLCMFVKRGATRMDVSRASHKGASGAGRRKPARGATSKCVGGPRRRPGVSTRATTHTQPSLSERTDSDAEPSHHTYRNTSKIIRPLRRRMNMSRILKRKPKTNTYRKVDLKNGISNPPVDNLGMNSNGGHNNYDESLAIPSTSSGYRGAQGSSSSLFRVTEADSDDQSVSSCPKSPNQPNGPQDEIPPLVNILPTPINGSRENIPNALRIDSSNRETDPDIVEVRRVHKRRRSSHGNRHRNGRLPLRRSDSSTSPSIIVESHRDSNNIGSNNVGRTEVNSTYTNSQPTGYKARVARLMNETNESEIESSCSTSSTVFDQVSPVRVRRNKVEMETPDSGIAMAPCSSTGSNQSQQTNSSVRPNPWIPDDWSDESEWVAIKHRQRVKKARRNYRTHIGDSDSN